MLGNVVANINLGKIYGIPIRLHWSWFVIFFFLTGSLSLGFYTNALPDEPGIVYWVMGCITSLLFFASVLGHEMGHALIACREKINVDHISLFLLGGAANITSEPRTSGEEFRISIAGPGVSLAIAIFSQVGYLAAEHSPYLALPLGWLARVNLVLVIFNMLPSLPLDGGRIFRSIIWQLTGNYQRATLWSERLSNTLAFSFIGLGAFIAFRGRLFDGIWVIFIGWFLQNAVASNREQSTLNRSLSLVKVENIMSQEFNQVSEGTSVARVIDTLVTEGWIPVIFVLARGRLKGMLLMHDLVTLPRNCWEGTTVEQVMVPLEPQVQIDPNSTLMTAMLAMDQFNMATLPVVSDGYPTGLISRDQVLEYIRYRTDTGI